MVSLASVSKVVSCPESSIAPSVECRIMGERPADDLRLLVNLFRHEMAVVAFVDQERGGDRPAIWRDTCAPLHRKSPRPHAEDRPIALLQEGDPVGEGRERHGVRTQEHLAVAIAEGERAAPARADQQSSRPEQDSKRKSASSLTARPSGRRRGPRLPSIRGPGAERPPRYRYRFRNGAVPLQFFAQFAEILDDAIMNDGDAGGRCGWALRSDRRAVRRPAGVADAAGSVERLLASRRSRAASLPSARTSVKTPSSSVAHTRRIVAAIFEALKLRQDGEQPVPYRNADYSAHVDSLSS